MVKEAAIAYATRKIQWSFMVLGLLNKKKGSKTVMLIADLA
ncbi:MAG: hypothetical protein CM1200mP13_05920 [Candidatus Pelagibacterales bacterium]|nr:MAG: hypothetical protein CM1200mP13_05920 [Pelagibacterales bacterium]